MRRLITLIATLVTALAGLTLAAGAPAATAAPTTCGTSTTKTLYAGQTTDAGQVVVGNDATNLYVTFTTTGGWQLSKTHVHAADSLAGIPVNKAGNPQIGNFRYQTTHNPPVTTFTYTIPKSAVGPDNNVNSLVVAAHADLVKVDGSGKVVASETGWGGGTRFTDRGSWATYLVHEWQSCKSEQPASKTETAFARLLPTTLTNAADDDQVTCFLDLDLNSDGTGDFNRWGWTNGPLEASATPYTFDVTAGAGQCKGGTKVGTLAVDYDGSTAKVTFQASGTNPATGLDYRLQETHLYVGSAPLPTNNGEYTVAPGQYPTIHGELKGVASDSYTVTGLSGPIHVVAHATVSGFPLP
jgi:hypothetical protein